MAGYSKLELYEMWRDNFRGQHDQVRVLMDFALCSKPEARSMIKDFETRHAAELLNMENRGKER